MRVKSRTVNHGIFETTYHELKDGIKFEPDGSVNPDQAAFFNDLMKNNPKSTREHVERVLVDAKSRAESALQGKLNDEAARDAGIVLACVNQVRDAMQAGDIAAAVDSALTLGLRLDRLILRSHERNAKCGKGTVGALDARRESLKQRDDHIRTDFDAALKSDECHNGYVNKKGIRVRLANSYNLSPDTIRTITSPRRK